MLIIDKLNSSKDIQKTGYIITVVMPNDITTVLMLAIFVHSVFR